MHLTTKQSNLINTAENTHNYMAQYTADAHGDEDHTDYYTLQFERDTSVLSRSTANDVGGIIIYMQKKQLVAYFDYENLQGTVFA